MKNKRFLSALACAALLAAPGALMADATDVSLFVGDEYVVSDEAAGQVYINDAGRTMIPLRVVGDAMGYDTEWSAGTVRVTGEGGAVDVTMTVGETAYTANGQAGSFETAPVIRNGRTYLPARDFSEIYGNIYWEGESRSVWITQDDATAYSVLGNSLLRSDANGIQPVAMPEDYEVSSFGKGDVVVNQRTIADTNYIVVNYDNNASGQCSLFRDDGDSMTRLATVNGTSSFTVDGDTVYHTMGTSAGPWTGDIVPEVLLVTDVTTGETASCTLDFAVNACDLQMQDGQLTAVDAEGTVHVIDPKALAAAE